MSKLQNFLKDITYYKKIKPEDVQGLKFEYDSKDDILYISTNKKSKYRVETIKIPYDHSLSDFADIDYDVKRVWGITTERKLLGITINEVHWKSDELKKFLPEDWIIFIETKRWDKTKDVFTLKTKQTRSPTGTPMLLSEQRLESKIVEFINGSIKYYNKDIRTNCLCYSFMIGLFLFCLWGIGFLASLAKKQEALCSLVPATVIERAFTKNANIVLTYQIEDGRRGRTDGTKKNNYALVGEQIEVKWCEELQ